MMAGVFPNEIVVLRVPVESCRGTTGDRDPRGLDFGENCSAGRIILSQDDGDDDVECGRS
jgi:hypothetical protein